MARPSPKARRPRGLTRAVGFTALILVLFVTTFSQTAQIATTGAGHVAVEEVVGLVEQQPSYRAASSVPAAAVPAAAAEAPPAAAREHPKAAVPAQLLHSKEATASLPAPLKPLLPTEPKLNLPEACHARAHTELEGSVVQWGSSHKKPDAGACCDACREHAQRHPEDGRECNVWVYCGDAALCGGAHQECWLKHAADPSEPPARGSGGRWTSGTVLPPGGGAALRTGRRWARAERQRAPLTVLHAHGLVVGLRNETGTIELLTPTAPVGDEPADPALSFPLPLMDTEINLGRGSYLDRRADGFHHLGDLTLQLEGGPTCSSVGNGAVRAHAGGPGGLLKDFGHGGGGGSGGALWEHSRPVPLVARQGGGGCASLSVSRTLTARRAEAGGALELRVTIKNEGQSAARLSALGLSMAFDQNFVGRTLPQVAHQASFVEPFLGGGGGYVQVTRATGRGPVLLLTPLDGTRLEAWRPLRNGEDKMRLDFMYEMSYELMLHTEAYTRPGGAWARASPWNAPTGATLAPGESRSYGLALRLAPSLQRVEPALLAAGRAPRLAIPAISSDHPRSPEITRDHPRSPAITRDLLPSARLPVATPLPGPLLGADMLNATLLVDVPWVLDGAGEAARQAARPTVAAHPPSALRVERRAGAGRAKPWCGAPACSHWRFALLPQQRPADGRVRLELSVPRAGGAPAHTMSARRPVSSSTLPLVAPSGPCFEAAACLARLRVRRAPPGRGRRGTFQRSRRAAWGARPAARGGAASAAGQGGRDSSCAAQVHLFLAQPARALVRAFGEHGAQKAWLPVGAADPWHRDGAFFGWDAAANARASGETRVYMSGLSDEAGAGAGLAMAVKQVGAPAEEEVARLEEYVEHTLYQGDRPERGRFVQATADDAVRLSQLYWSARTAKRGRRGGRTARGHALLRPRLGRSRGSAPSATSEDGVRRVDAARRPHRGGRAEATARTPGGASPPRRSDAMNDPNSPEGRAATAAAPDLARTCRRCWPQRTCSWMDCWSEEHSLESWRAYNYPHVTAVYWSLYRLGRWHSPPLTKRRDWSWYLTRAHATAMALWTRGGDPWTKKMVPAGCKEGTPGCRHVFKQGNGTGTAQWGLMVGSVFELLLSDLHREGWDAQARALQESVERRMAIWLKMPFPYGSEFSWDSTGHEEIATWMLRFDKPQEARQTLDAVAAYVSLSPHWAYCGSARRWWDFTINGHTQRGNERAMHHYAAALNSIPIFDHALRTPSDPWLWRMAQCAGGGTLSNIRPDGSSSMGLHGDPDMLSLDADSADFGVGFYGHWKNAGAYLSCSAELGWLCLGCDLVSAPDAPCEPERGGAEGELLVLPRDAFRRRVYLQPLGLLLVVDGAEATRVRLSLRAAARVARVELAPSAAGATHAMLQLTADGSRDAPRRVRLLCDAPCGFEPLPFAGAADEMHYLRLGGGPAGATLTIELLDP